MRINGIWCGWGLGDNSLVDFTVQQFKAFARRMYRSYMGDLADTNAFDQQLFDELCQMQDRLVASGALVVGQFIRGVLDLPTEYACGFKKRPAALGICFTVEGHMSNMWIGPAAGGAAVLESQGVFHHQPIGYPNSDIPFKNQLGLDELDRLFSAGVMDNGVPFPIGTPWWIWGFSQGSMIISQFMARYVLPVGAKHNARLADFRRGLAIGNPQRERGKLCPWAVSQEPQPNSGIMLDELFVTTGTAIEGRWEENAHTGDLFADCAHDAEGRDKATIANIIAESSGISGLGALFGQVLAIMGNPTAQAFPAIKALFDTIVFFASNPNPHYSTVAEAGDIQWMRGTAA